MSQLTTKFVSETGLVAMYRKDGVDYHTLRYVNWLEALVEKFNSVAQSGPTNKPGMPVCPHARLKWSIYDCSIKDSFALDLMDCNGEGTYSIPGNSGVGYSHQCNKVPGKPAYVG